MKPQNSFDLQELQRGLKELEIREMHPLRVYRPTANQLAIHESQASEVIVVGGKRSGKEQPVDEPVLTPDGWVPIGSLSEGDVIIGGDGLPCIVSGVFPQGIKPVMRVTFSDGSWTRCGEDHLWKIQSAKERNKVKSGQWEVMPLSEIVARWGAEPLPADRPSIPVCNVWMPERDMPVAPYLMGILLGDGHFGRTSTYFSTADQEIVDSVRSLVPAGLTLRKTKHYGKVTYDYHITGGNHCGANSLVVSLRLLGLDGKRSWEKHVPNCYLLNKSWARLEVLRGLMDSDGTVSESGASFTTTSLELAQNVVDLVRSLGGKASVGSWRIKKFTYKGEVRSGRPCITVTVRMLDSCPFKLERKARLWRLWREGASEKPHRVLRSVEREGVSECVCISVTCPDSTYITRDYIVTHNTLATVMEFGSRLLGIPITRPDGTQIKGRRFKRPSDKNPKLYWVIGLDVQHIGQTLYHRLFSPGLGCDFRIIKDKITGQWRAYNPNFDADREDETVLSPPMFGESIIDPKSWHMESAAGNIFKSVRFINGVTLCAYATTGDYPKQGDAVDGIWLDEDTANAEFLKEWHDRLSTRRGWWLWSVWPKVANEALIKTIERAKDYEDNPDPPIKLVQLVGSENPYSDKKGIEEALARMDDDDDEAHRDRGDISAFISGRQMYDFGSAVHLIKPMPELERPDNPYSLFSKMLSQDKKFPSTWTRYMAIDPSHTRTACLVGVVPPPEWDGVVLGSRLIIETEIVARKHTPSMLAALLLSEIGDQRFETFIMDQMIGRQTTVGSDTTVFVIYEGEFRKRGLVSRLSNSGFMRGCNDKQLRRRTVRQMLEPIEGGQPQLFVSNKCGQTIREFYSYRKKEVKDSQGRQVPMDDAANERVHDCMAALEYLCQYVSERFRDSTAYVEPERAKTNGSFAYRSAMEIIAKMDKDEGGYVHMGPGGRA
jgi:hypothetical protein